MYLVTCFVTFHFRFLAVNRPIGYRNAQQARSCAKQRAAKYIVPAILAAVIFNIPKFLEVQVCIFNVFQLFWCQTQSNVTQVNFVNGTAHFNMTELRVNPNYVWWFTHSLLVHPLLTTTIFPILILCILNQIIYR